MTTPVRFWVDPICPWCWTTSQWIRRIADEKNLAITWEPISLLVKNDPAPDSPFYEPLVWTRGLLRVMESVRAAGHDDRVGDLYTDYGRRIHHEGERLFDPALALAAVGLDTAHADGLKLWDAFVTMTELEEFWELKRTRTVRPEFGDAP